MDLISEFLNGNYMPHGHCFLWRRDLLLMHVGGDVLTATAYFAIPAALVKLVHKRSDLAFNWIFLMFALFIFCCGVTHIISTVNIWHGYYHIEGMAKMMTALVSLITAFLVCRLLPAALAVPGHKELMLKNNELIALEEKLRQTNADLENRVQERTLELERLALTDSLTGVSNRRALMESLDSEMDRMRRHGNELSVLMLDLDDFKRFNDTYGHQEGDNLLQAIASLFQRECRPSDIVARYGGEEFLIILPETNADEATTFATRLLQSVRSSPVRIGNEDVGITCSIGVAHARPGESIDLLIKRADEAMYSAKQSGKDTLVTTAD